jgi:hypothetical protein
LARPVPKKTKAKSAAPKRKLVPSKTKSAKVAAKAPKKALAKASKTLKASKGSAKGPKSAAIPAPQSSAPRRDGFRGPLPDRPLPRNQKLPPEGTPLNKREMEQVLSVGMRGVVGEGSLKGRVIVYQKFPYLEVVGRDRRELYFLLQGRDEERLPAYEGDKMSVLGLIKKFHNHGGSVDVRKFSAKKTEAEETVAPVEENKLRLLSPGEVQTIAGPGMSVGVRGVATLRGKLEQSGEEYYLVVSNAGTRQRVAFTLQGKGVKSLKKYVGDIVVATGIVEKSTGWGGTIQTENCEARAPDYPPVARESIEVIEIESNGTGASKAVEVKLNHGLSVKLAEKQGSVWAIEPTTAKRVSLREVNLSHDGGNLMREFFFTPRNPGPQEIDFYLSKVHNPMQVSRTFKVSVNVKPTEVVPQ